MRRTLSDLSRQRLRTTTTILATALVIAPATALASHGFTDVASGEFFHEAVDWMRENRVTVGCNPPDNTEYCPDDFVTRGQMAVFLERLDTRDVFLRPGEVSRDGGDADTLDGNDATAFRTLVERVTQDDKVAIDGGCDSYVSVTIDVPTDGKILVEADVNLRHEHVNGASSGAFLRLGASSSDCTAEVRPDPNEMLLTVPDTAPSDVLWTQTHVSRQFDVAAGTHTFYLNGFPAFSTTSTEFWHGALWATFYPG